VKTTKLFVAIIITALFLITLQTAAASTPQQTVVLTYSNVGRSPIYWGATPNALRAQGYNVIQLMSTNADLKQYSIEIDQQMQKTPDAVWVTFSDSDTSVIQAALTHNVKTIIFVESVPATAKNPLSDITLMSIAWAIKVNNPLTYTPIFETLGNDRTVVGTMLDSLVLNHPWYYEYLISATASNTINGPLFGLVNFYEYSLTHNWINDIKTLRTRGVQMYGICGSASLETQQWALDNGIHFWTVSSSKHLPQCEQETRFTQTLIWELKGYLT
jgi:hypothetical protein